MATMKPELSATRLEELARTKSSAEVRFYRACKEQLPARVIVYYSVNTLNERMEVGEADFVIIDPQRGMLVVEIKGGGVCFDPATGVWTSTDSEDVVHEIKDPFAQARERCYDFYDQFKEDTAFLKCVQGRITKGWAAFFPHLTRSQVNSIKRPDARPEIMGGRDDLTRLNDWYNTASTAWRQPREVELGPQGARIVDAIICGPINVRPLLSSKLRDEEEKRIQLTREQSIILNLLGARTPIGISGGAGTGKTLLAIEQARRWAQAGKRVLLLCYNRALLDHLRDVCGTGTTIEPYQIHKYCETWAGRVGHESGRNLLEEAERAHPGEDRFKVQLPYALTTALTEFDPPSYDAIVVDEGQDFSPAEWEAVDALRDITNAVFCVFFDHNQQLYPRAGKFLLKDERDLFPLYQNCRNTKPIHQACYRFYRGPDTKEPPIDGKAIQCEIADTLEKQAQLIAKSVRHLIDEKVSPEEIAVLVLGTEGKNTECFEALKRHHLVGGVSWADKTHRQPSTILIDTVMRFKGLERWIIFLWIGSDVDPGVHRRLLYVGMSRAKSRLFLVGTADACKSAQEPPAASDFGT